MQILFESVRISASRYQLVSTLLGPQSKSYSLVYSVIRALILLSHHPSTCTRISLPPLFASNSVNVYLVCLLIICGCLLSTSLLYFLYWACFQSTLEAVILTLEALRIKGKPANSSSSPTHSRANPKMLSGTRTVR